MEKKTKRKENYSKHLVIAPQYHLNLAVIIVVVVFVAGVLLAPVWTVVRGGTVIAVVD